MPISPVTCPCGRPADYVHVRKYFPGHGDIVVGGDYWHDEDEKCPRSHE